MKILFVCEGNINRSQMAATVLKALQPKLDVSSAGTLVPKELEGKPVSSASQRGIEYMKKVGYDMSEHVMRRLTPQMIEEADRVILAGPTPGGALPRFLLNTPKLERWNVPDPGWGHCTVEAARDMIIEEVQKLVGTLQNRKKTK